MPPASAKRPTTGMRARPVPAAFDRDAACPLLSNQPATQTPFAWLRRNPAWVPLTSWKAAIIRSWVSRVGESQPPAQPNAPATLSITAPIAPSRTGTPTLVSRAALNQNGFIFSTRISDRWDCCGYARSFSPGSLTFATCNRLFRIAARLKLLRLMAQLYVGNRPTLKRIVRVIRRFVVQSRDRLPRALRQQFSGPLGSDARVWNWNL